MSESVFFDSSDGLRIEGVVDQIAEPRAVFVFCHPHPQMGGTMNAPLLVSLSEEIVDSDWAVLRFNFRGIGASEGETGTGEAEVADARGAVRFARKRWPGLPLAIGGWSFGAAVAVRTALAEDGLVGCVAIAPAVEAKPGVTAGVPPPTSGKLDCPLLAVWGANDRQVSPEAIRSWAEDVGAKAIEVEGANHFFWAKYEDLASEVVGFLEGLIDGGR